MTSQYSTTDLLARRIWGASLVCRKWQAEQVSLNDPVALSLSATGTVWRHDHVLSGILSVFAVLFIQWPTESNKTGPRSGIHRDETSLR